MSRVYRHFSKAYSKMVVQMAKILFVFQSCLELHLAIATTCHEVIYNQRVGFFLENFERGKIPKHCNFIVPYVIPRTSHCIFVIINMRKYLHEVENYSRMLHVISHAPRDWKHNRI